MVAYRLNQVNEIRKSMGYEDLVEPRGIEPLTSCMPCKRSPS